MFLNLTRKWQLSRLQVLHLHLKSRFGSYLVMTTSQSRPGFKSFDKNSLRRRSESVGIKNSIEQKIFGIITKILYLKLHLQYLPHKTSFTTFTNLKMPAHSAFLPFKKPSIFNPKYFVIFKLNCLICA